MQWVYDKNGLSQLSQRILLTALHKVTTLCNFFIYIGLNFTSHKKSAKPKSLRCELNIAM